MKEYIGGFLELELFAQPGPGYHAEAVGLQNARACVSHVVKQTGMRAIWLPYYTCDALLQPFADAGVSYRFYALNEALEMIHPLTLATDEYLVYVNYFGLKNAYVHQLVALYGNNLLVDNTQDYFARGYEAGWSFNSARKSFGVPDGGYLYGPAAMLGSAGHYPLNTQYHAQYLIDRLRGNQQAAYQGFIAYERTLNSEPLQTSEFSAALLSQVDYAEVAAQRRANYRRYHAAFAEINSLSIVADFNVLPDDTVPFCYPLLPPDKQVADRQALFHQNIFVAWLWPDVLKRQSEGFAWERHLTTALLPLPVDHRYGPAEIDRVIAAVSTLMRYSVDTIKIKNSDD